MSQTVQRAPPPTNAEEIFHITPECERNEPKIIISIFMEAWLFDFVDELCEFIGLVCLVYFSATNRKGEK